MGLRQEINNLKYTLKDKIFERKLETLDDCENLIKMIKELQDLILKQQND